VKRSEGDAAGASTGGAWGTSWSLANVAAADHAEISDDASAGGEAMAGARLAGAASGTALTGTGAGLTGMGAAAATTTD
jgi:hypothetical protein